jgi:ATP-dependent RNA helicase MRH4, mitochondrial
MASVHGKAELMQLVMRAIDRLEIQHEWKTNGKLRLMPAQQYYLYRAYYILRGWGDWEHFKLTRLLEEAKGHSRINKPKHSLWNSFRYQVDGDIKSNHETGEQVVGNFRRFLEKFTDTQGSETARNWNVSGVPMLDTLSKKDALRSSRPLDHKAKRDLKLQTRAAEEAAKSARRAAAEKDDDELVDLPEMVPKEVPEEEVPKEEMPEEEVPEIWRPNQKDLSLRQSTFSHPSQTTLAQATKQLRSSWSPNSFHDLNLVKTLPEAIESITLGHLGKKEIQPTDIQALAIPVITKLDTAGFADETPQFRSFLIAAETGSGKTLAYVIPLINRIKAEEEWALQNPTSPHSIFNTHRAASPRAVIIAPTSELAEQIYKILKRLSHEIKFKVCALLPKFDDSVVRKSILPKYIDILVSTPHRLNEFMQSNEIKSNLIKYLIIDEADTIFDRSFLESLNPILHTVKPQLTHLVLCTATIPLALEERLHKNFGSMQRIVAPKIHTAPRRINFQVMIESDKREALFNTLRSIQTDDTEPDHDIKRVIVFCNVREGVREVYEYLKSAEEVHIAEGNEGRFELIPFTRDNFDRHTALERFNEETEKSDKLRILITTDMGSRGLDTIAAKTVILFDVPYSSIDLLHRLGRTARAGTRGRAFMIVSKAEYRGRTKEWVNEIRDRLIKGEALV